jgi:hypothetical protein
VAASIGGLLAVVGVFAGALIGHAVDPRERVQSIPTTLPPSTVTATATAFTTATATATKTQPVIVPSPVYVTVGPTEQQMTQLEAQAYCQNLAIQAWPDAPTTGDPTLDQAGRAYTNLQRERAYKQCMSDHGY